LTTQRQLNLLSGRESHNKNAESKASKETNASEKHLLAKQHVSCCEVHKKAGLLLLKMEGLNTWDLNKGTIKLSKYLL
jgi:hypothetical protein